MTLPPAPQPGHTAHHATAHPLFPQHTHTHTYINTHIHKDRQPIYESWMCAKKPPKILRKHTHNAQKGGQRRTRVATLPAS